MAFGKAVSHPVADLLNRTSINLEGPSASTRGTTYEKYLAPPIEFHASNIGLSEPPATKA